MQAVAVVRSVCNQCHERLCLFWLSLVEGNAQRSERLKEEDENHEPSSSAARMLDTSYAERIKRHLTVTDPRRWFQRETTKTTFIVLETDSWKWKWDSLITVWILFSAVEVPIRLSFGLEAKGWQLALDTFISLCFLADLAIAFNTAFMDNGVWVTSRSAIAARYLRGWFWIDAPSSVPVELIEMIPWGDASQEGEDGSLAAFRLLRMVRLLRLLRLLKLEIYVRKLEERLEDALDSDLGVLRIVKLVIKLLFISHFLCCGWMALASWSRTQQRKDGQSPVSWISEYNDGAALDGPFTQQYLYAFHYALSVLVGHDSDILPVTDLERQFDVFAALLGALVFGYVIGEIGTLVAHVDRQASLVEDRLDIVKQYLRWRQIPKDLSLRIRRYYEHFYEQRSVNDEQSILTDLNPTLHGELVTHILQRTLGRLPLFKRLSIDFQIAAFPLLKPLTIAPDEVVFKKGSASKDLLFLLEGEIDILSAFDGVSPVCRMRALNDVREAVMLTEGTDEGSNRRWSVAGCFGHSVLLGTRRPATYVAHSQADLLCIAKADLLKLFAADPVSSRRVCRMVLKDHDQQQIIRKLTITWRIRSMPQGEQRAAWVCQSMWNRYCLRQAMKLDEVYKLIREQQGDHERESFAVHDSTTVRDSTTVQPSSKRTANGLDMADSSDAASSMADRIPSQSSITRIERKLDAALSEAQRGSNRAQSDGEARIVQELAEIKQSMQLLQSERAKELADVKESVARLQDDMQHSLREVSQALRQLQLQPAPTPTTVQRDVQRVAAERLRNHPVASKYISRAEREEHERTIQQQHVEQGLHEA